MGRAAFRAASPGAPIAQSKDTIGDDRGGPPHGNAYGYYRNRGYPVTGAHRTKCNKHGKCTVTYYDPRQDRNDGYRDNPRYWDGYRWRYRD